MEIERITPQTASIASRIYVSSWRAGYQGIVPQSYLDSLSVENWMPKLVSQDTQNYILKDNGKYLAASSVSPARDPAMKGWGEIISLYVLPGYFRKGYGRILFSHMVRQLQIDGFMNIYLWVLEENHRARAFYKDMGFIPNGDQTRLSIHGKDLIEVRYTANRQAEANAV